MKSTKGSSKERSLSMFQQLRMVHNKFYQNDSSLCGIESDNIFSFFFCVCQIQSHFEKQQNWLSNSEHPQLFLTVCVALEFMVIVSSLFVIFLYFSFLQNLHDSQEVKCSYEKLSLFFLTLKRWNYWKNEKIFYQYTQLFENEFYECCHFLW